jgi:hypothetical protein
MARRFKLCTWKRRWVATGAMVGRDVTCTKMSTGMWNCEETSPTLGGRKTGTSWSARRFADIKGRIGRDLREQGFVPTTKWECA